MLKVFFLSIIITAITASTIYEIKVKSIEGDQIDFNDFKGKKMLIVNIATESAYASQLTSLDKLQKKYPDSLVVIAVPSNSFGKESKNEQSIKSKLKSGYQVSYIIT